MGYEQAPLIKERLQTSEIFNVQKGTRDEIFEFMMEDLSDENIAALPDKNSFVHGRTNQDAARMLRTKLILFHRAESLYPQALADMRAIMNNGYELMKDYGQIWLKAGEFCSESIYEIEFASDNQGEGNTVLCRSLSGRGIVDPRSGDQGGLTGGYGQNTMPSTIYNMFKEGDTRREGTVIVYAEEARKCKRWWQTVNCPQAANSLSATNRRTSKDWATTSTTAVWKTPTKSTPMTTAATTSASTAMPTCCFWPPNCRYASTAR